MHERLITRYDVTPFAPGMYDEIDEPLVPYGNEYMESLENEQAVTDYADVLEMRFGLYQKAIKAYREARDAGIDTNRYEKVCAMTRSILHETTGHEIIQVRADFDAIMRYQLDHWHDEEQPQKD